MIDILKRYIRRRRANRIFPGTAAYWEQRYASGGTSGAGSYGRLADFKAAFLNDFVRSHAVETVIEVGCGDGNQLSLSDYPRYLGLDISKSAIDLCIHRFSDDFRKSFMLFDPSSFMDRAGFMRADAVLSLDVLFHLVEPKVFDAYMRAIFDMADRFVVIYASDISLPRAGHEHRRPFSEWISVRKPEWRLLAHVPNPFPYDVHSPNDTSYSDFFVYTREVEVSS